MSTTMRPIGHDDRLSLVEHLDELRTRLIICVAALVVALGFAFWQNHALLNLLNAPLKETTKSAAKHARGPLGEAARFNVMLRKSLQKTEQAFELLSRSRAALSPEERAAAVAAAQANADALRAAPHEVTGRQPVTLGLGEPFSQTLTVAAYFAFLLALPIILYQAYAFVLPAFSPRERRVALPLMLMIPFLFIGGVVFGYFLVLPAAIGFLQNFNNGEFDVLVQAKSLYSFSVLTLIGMGVLFQLPVGVLALTRLGVVTPRQLRKNWRYAVVIISVVAVLLPGTDPVTTCIEMIPMLILYGASILLATWVERFDRRAVEADALALDESDSLDHTDAD
jgi:sec-independent protein translocase protein TatC